MSDGIVDEGTEVTPVAALPLNYSDRRVDALRSILRLVAWIFVLGQIEHASWYLFDLACYFWERNDPTVVHKLLSGASLLIKAPEAVVAIYLCINSPNIVELNKAGRKQMATGAVVQAAIAFLTYAYEALEVALPKHLYRPNTAYGVKYLLEYCLYAVTAPSVYILIFRIFDSKSARDAAK